MIVLERKATPGRHTHLTCEAPGCRHSARWDFILLHGHHTFLCSDCKNEWGKAYDAAFSGWVDEARQAA